MYRFGSVCSGIEAASVAWEPLGWRADWLAEIEPFPAAVLAHHYPDVVNLGDMTKIAEMVATWRVAAPDILVGGTPCQAFSVAGLREGLSDPRGELTIKYVELANAIDDLRRHRGEQPAVIVWENVPGVLSSKDNAFGCFLGALAGEDCALQPAGGKWTNAGCVFGPQRAIAWRVLDAQYFGVAQRRRRVFVVASARDGFDPAKVLFEWEGVRRDTAPRRETGQDVAGTLASRTGAGGFPGTDESLSGYVQPVEKWPADIACTLNAAFGSKLGLEDQHINGGAPLFVPAPLFVTSDQANAAVKEDCALTLMASHGQPYICQTAYGIPGNWIGRAVSVHGTQDPDIRIEQAHALGRNSGQENAVLAFSCKDYGADAGEISPTLRAMGHGESHANAGGQVAVCITGSKTHALTAEGFDASEDGTGRGTPIVNAYAFAENSRSEVRLEGGDGQIVGTLSTGGGKPGQGQPCVAMQSAVRRLTPRECERLQGFPDDYTQIPWRKKPASECPDGPRYKALGNSMAVPCMRFIGERLAAHLAELDAVVTP